MIVRALMAALAAPTPGFVPTVDASGQAVAPELGEADRTMLMRN